MNPAVPGEGALRTLQAALDRAGKRWRSQGGGYMAQCPAHEDRVASLSFTNGNGKVLLECKAGCATIDVLAALTLEWSDMFDGPRGETWTRPIPMTDITYDYRDMSGVLLYQKVRKPSKQFKIRRPDGTGGWIYEIGDSTRVLYRLPEVIAGVRAGRRVIIAEGEKDVDRLVALNEVATCNFDGASKDKSKPKWRPEYSDTLEGADVIVIADNDDAGFAHARAVATSLTGIADTVGLYRGAVCREGADVSDHLDAGYGLAELVPLRPDDVPMIVEDADSLADLYTPIDWHALWSTTSGEPDWLIPGIIERGRLHSIYAPKKHKKSLVTLLMVAELVTGREMFGHPNPHENPMRVLYIDIENATEDIRQRLEAAGYGPDDLANLKYFSFPSLPALDTAAGGVHLLALVDRHRPDLLVLDTTSRVVSGKENDSDTFRALYRHALAPIKAAGQTAVLRLDHSGKDLEKGQRGSSAKGDDLDTAWEVKLPDGPYGARVVLRLDFQRTNHHPQEIELVQHGTPLRFIRSDEASIPPKVAHLIREMDRLGVPVDAGRRAARGPLTAAGIEARDTDLAQAVKIRKSGSQDHGTGAAINDLEKIDKTGSAPDFRSDVSAAHTGSEPVGNRGNHSGWSETGGTGSRFPVSRRAPGTEPTPPDGANHPHGDRLRCTRCDQPTDQLTLGECPACIWQRGPVTARPPEAVDLLNRPRARGCDDDGGQPTTRQTQGADAPDVEPGRADSAGVLRRADRADLDSCGGAADHRGDGSTGLPEVNRSGDDSRNIAPVVEGPVLRCRRCGVADTRTMTGLSICAQCAYGVPDDGGDHLDRWPVIPPAGEDQP